MTNDIFLGLGSNKGNKIEFIRSAIEILKADPKIKIESASSLYESEPYGLKEQDTFFNAVIKIKSSYDLHELHAKIKSVEKEIGRQNGTKWGPREIDIDLLFFGKTIFSDEKLTVPHKEILLRDFVIIPLSEISENFVHPQTEKKLSEVDLSKIEKLIFKKHEFDLLKNEKDQS